MRRGVPDPGQEHRPVHPNSLANLRAPWGPGECPNPGGRPKGASVLSAMLRDLARDPDEDGIGKRAREVAQAIVDVSTGVRSPDEVDTKAALAILDRTDGPLVKERKVEMTMPPITVEGIDKP